MRSKLTSVMLILLVLLAFLAIMLSYTSIVGFKSGLEAKLSCKDGEAVLTLKNYGQSVKVFYISIVRGDEIIEVKEVGLTIDSGGELSIPLNIPNKNVKVSILFERGVIPGLSCGMSATSEP